MTDTVMNAVGWMDRFGVDPSTSGDIAERSAGRSMFWLCRQVAVAIGATMYRSIRGNPIVALLTALATAAVLSAWIESTLALYLWLSRMWLNDWASVGATWVDGVRVGDFWSRALWVWWEMYGGGLSLIWCAGAAVIGRQVARMTSLPLAVVVTLAVVPIAVWRGAPMWHPSYGINWIVVATITLIGIPMATLAGGLSLRVSRAKG